MKCDSTRFEMKQAEPAGGAWKLYFVQCSACGGVVGVTEFFNISAMLQQLGRKMGINLG